jgi:hypothetical protein
MLKIVHIRKPISDQVKELAAIFIADDTRRQEKEIEKLKQRATVKKIDPPKD